jgi:hypothetical protein
MISVKVLDEVSESFVDVNVLLRREDMCVRNLVEAALERRNRALLLKVPFQLTLTHRFFAQNR